MVKKALILTVIFAALVSACIKEKDLTSTGKVKETAIKTVPPLQLSTWVVDWQWEASIHDLKQLSNGLKSFQIFAAYFDDQDKLYFTEQMQTAMPQFLDTAKQMGLEKIDLTIVNDIINTDGTTIQKDSTLITRLIATKESREKHINEMINVVNQYDLSGVEIDFEMVKEKDWKKLITFYSELYQRLHKEGKTLRIVLEPRMPIEKWKLPKGPTYVMMAYNLYGTHSEPGPKADYAFITKLAKRMKNIPGNPAIAIATGGFDWSANGNITSLTEKQAAQLANKSTASIKRDPASGSLYFTYLDDYNVKHTVWYADSTTLLEWIKKIRKKGYHKVAIWRLGELGEDTLKMLGK